MTMDVKKIEFTKETIVEEASIHSLAPGVVDLPEGQAFCVQAQSTTIITAEDAQSGQSFVLLIAVANHGGQALGSLSPMSAQEARSFAASLIDAANDIDGGANV